MERDKYHYEYITTHPHIHIVVNIDTLSHVFVNSINKKADLRKKNERIINSRKILSENIDILLIKNDCFFRRRDNRIIESSIHQSILFLKYHYY
jgi:hypothetical protein